MFPLELPRTLTLVQTVRISILTLIAFSPFPYSIQEQVYNGYNVSLAKIIIVPISCPLLICTLLPNLSFPVFNNESSLKGAIPNSRFILLDLLVLACMF